MLMLEYAPPQRRGYFAALPFMGVMLGTVMAAAIYFLPVKDGDISHTSLWRVPFLLIIIGVAVWIRLKLKESPSFIKLEARQQADAHPLAHIMKNSKANVLKVIGLRMAENGGSSIMTLEPWMNLFVAPLRSLVFGGLPARVGARAGRWVPGGALIGQPDAVASASPPGAATARAQAPRHAPGGRAAPR